MKSNTKKAIELMSGAAVKAKIDKKNLYQPMSLMRKDILEKYIW